VPEYGTFAVISGEVMLACIALLRNTGEHRT
jgi:hypothetical protein